MNQPLDRLKKTWWIGWTSWPSSLLVEKKFEIFIEYSFKKKESIKNGTQFQVWMRKIWSKQAQVLRIQTCSYELWLNWNFVDRPSLLRKTFKFWQNVPSIVRNPLKKRCMIPSSEEGDMIKTITKNQCSTPAEPAEPAANQPTGCKKFWKFYRMFLEE